jgi:GTP-binding protein EngB required for normal cell division
VSVVDEVVRDITYSGENRVATAIGPSNIGKSSVLNMLMQFKEWWAFAAMEMPPEELQRLMYQEGYDELW